MFSEISSEYRHHVWTGFPLNPGELRRFYQSSSAKAPPAKRWEKGYGQGYGDENALPPGSGKKRDPGNEVGFFNSGCIGFQCLWRSCWRELTRIEIICQSNTETPFFSFKKILMTFSLPTPTSLILFCSFVSGRGGKGILMRGGCG